MGQQVCAPWTTPDKLCNQGDGTTADCAGGTSPLVYRWTAEEVILAASNILYLRTCGLYGGVCEYAVWPCIEGCFAPDEAIPCVPCYRGRVIVLPSEMPVVSITSIEEDGVTLDPSAYRLERKRIVRLDGKAWQRNTFGLPGLSGVETVVTFMAGQAPPIELQIAAAALADEMWKACNGDSCAIDPRINAVARRGVQIELNDLQKILDTGTTGIPDVDRALAVHGDCVGTATMQDTAEPYRGQRAN